MIKKSVKNCRICYDVEKLSDIDWEGRGLLGEGQGVALGRGIRKGVNLYALRRKNRTRQGGVGMGWQKP